jgi:valyl-tRNA synthetase
MVKPAYGQPMDRVTFGAVTEILENNLKVLHPFVPFVSEEIWQSMKQRNKKEALIISSWPKSEEFDASLIEEFVVASEVVSGIRSIRKEKNISYKDLIELQVLNNENLSSTFDPIIEKMGNISSLGYAKEQVKGALSFRVKSNEYFIPVTGVVDVEAEKAKLEEELNYTRGFLKSVEKKLSNEKFVSGAPVKVVDMEKQKKADAEAKIEAILASLKVLS